MTDTRVVLEDRWIRVRAEDCRTSAGVRVAPYYVLDYTDWVQIICIDDQSRICLTQQYRHGAGRIVAELPCGGVNPGESPLAAAQRELLEETGIVAEAWRLLGEFSPNPANHSNRVHIFGCEHGRTDAATSDPTEDLNWRFASRSDLETAIETGEFLKLMHLGARHLARRAGFWSD